MKYLFYIIILILSTNCYCQSITQEEFDKIYNEIKYELFVVKSNKDFPMLFKKVNLSQEDIEKTVDLTKENIMEFNSDVEIRADQQNFLLPFFKDSNIENRIHLTIYGFTPIPEKSHQDLSDFGFANYHFILECLVGLEKNKVVYENATIKIEKKDIEHWYLFHHKNYYKVTKMVHKKYGSIPPPPPPIPNSMDNSPYHIDITVNEYITNNQWNKAELLYDKLIGYYPYDAILYYRRGYVKHLSSKYTEAIQDFSKSIELDRDYADSYRYRGLAYYNNNEYQKALNDLNTAIDKDSQNSMYYVVRAYIYLELNSKSNACKDINQAVTLGIFSEHPISKNDITNFQKFCNE